MEKYSKLEIENIINNCEILFLPENSSIEDALEQELVVSSNTESVRDFVTVETLAEETDEDFENIYQKSKECRGTLQIRPSIDYSYLSASESTSIDEPDAERVLTINRTLKDHLLHFRQRIFILIGKIDSQYRKNNIFLEEAKSSNGMEETSFKTSYIKCGAPFFKDALGDPAPYNDDYKYRKNRLKEFFPFDLPSSSARWKTREKVALISGVKQQMIEHIKSQQSRRLCEDRMTRETLQKMKFISHSQDLKHSPVIEIYRTVQQEHPDFAINWNLISFSSLQSNHSVSECMGMWYSYLRPDLNREPFSEKENETLEMILTEQNFESWNEIANQLDRRSPLQTFVHFQSVFSRFYPSNVRWTQDEDDKLLNSVDKHSVNGIINWGKVGQLIPLRNKTQCYNRFQIIAKFLTTKKGTFSRQENRAIIEYVEQFGENAFKRIPSEFLPGRSSIQIKNHYQIALKHNGAIHPWTREEDAKLMHYVEKSGTNDWSAFARDLKTHNRLSCRTRYHTITRFLKKNPGSAMADVPTKLKKVTGARRAKESGDSEGEEANESKTAISKFKSQQPEMFNLFRQLYNFDFSVREIKANNENLLVLMSMFRIQKYKIPDRRVHQFTSGQLLKFSEIMELNVRENVAAEIKFAREHSHFLMPPNYNTIVGLRYITIKKHEEPLNDETDDETVPVTTPSKHYRDALLDFQKLYFSLFYWSAMLTKIEANEANSIHFMKSDAATTTSGFLRLYSKRKLPFKLHSNAKKAKLV